MSNVRARHGMIAAAVSLALLGGLAAETRMRPKAADAEPYHKLIRDAAAQAPMVIGDWEGVEIPQPPHAIELLKPNAILSRKYVNQRTGEVVRLLMVHCKDAQDIYGHYPPVCYPSQGMRQQRAADASWTVDGVAIEGKEYHFVGQRLSRGELLVQNFII